MRTGTRIWQSLRGDLHAIQAGNALEIQATAKPPSQQVERPLSPPVQSPKCAGIDPVEFLEIQLPIGPMGSLKDLSKDGAMR